MSISDRIAVMRAGVLQQLGHPQDIYDAPVNLFVAKFLGTPPISVFDGTVRAGSVYIGGDRVLDAPGVPDGDVYVGIRPEGFVPAADGALRCAMRGVEVMGRDISILAAHPACAAPVIRAIVSAEARAHLDALAGEVRFTLKPGKTHLFSRESEERLVPSGR